MGAPVDQSTRPRPAPLLAPMALERVNAGAAVALARDSSLASGPPRSGLTGAESTREANQIKNLLGWSRGGVPGADRGSERRGREPVLCVLRSVLFARRRADV